MVRRLGPVPLLLLLAPVLGEGLSTATPPLDLLLPWNLALFVALYGCGALLIREVCRRRGLGPAGFVLLATAYGVYEEALVDRFWFTPEQWRAAGLGDYSALWHTNLLLAAHLTLFHVAVSIGATIVLVERLVPDRSATPWLGTRGLVVAGAALLVVPPLLFGQYDVRPLPQLLVAAALLVALMVAAFRVPRPERRVEARPATAWIAFACTGAHFVLTYAVPSTGLPWPIGLAVALAPAGLGVVLLRRADPLRIVIGVLAFFCLLCTAVGLAGRYDTTLLGLLGAAALFAIVRRTGRTSP